MNNYGELKTAVADWLDREDLTTVIPQFVDLTEREIYRGLRCEDNEFVATYDNANWRIDGHPDVAVTPGIHVTFPQNYKEMNLVTWNDRTLQHISQQQLEYRLVNRLDFFPNSFAITGRKIAFSQAIDEDPSNWGDGDTLKYVYYGTESLNGYPTYQVPTNPVDNPAVEDTTPENITQSDDNTTRMFQRNPDMYLHGVLYFASLYLKQGTDAQLWGTLFNKALEEMRQESKRARFAGSSSSVVSAYGA